MKHVLVLFDYPASLDFLAAQRLKRRFNRLDCDSRDIWGMQQLHDKRIALQSTDGIEFHHFHDAWPPETGKEVANNFNINWWIIKLQNALPPGETLDAVVIPPRHANTQTQAWMQTLKQEFPDIKELFLAPQQGWAECLRPATHAANALRQLLAMPLGEQPKPVAAR